MDGARIDTRVRRGEVLVLAKVAASVGDKTAATAQKLQAGLGYGAIGRAAS